MSSQEIQETTTVTRKSLKTIQHAENDIENLVGRASKTLKHQISQESSSEPVDAKTKNVLTKETQVNFDRNITEDDLTNPDGPSEKYWKILFQKRQIAFQETLEENEKLHKIIEDLKEENNLLKQMLDEANSFVEIVKEELIGNSNDDTGVDVNDISTADDTADEAN